MRLLFAGISTVLLFGMCVTAFCEEAEKVSVCQLKNDPAAFNHKLVEVTTFVSHGFEDFALQEPTCDSKFDIWVEYGGKTASGTMYCCGVTNARSRPNEMEVEGISIPLVEDENFHELDQLLQVPGTDSLAHTTLVGRFFSGRQISYPNGTHWGGYGHMGCCSLLVIEQVLAVDPHDRQDLDYAAFADAPDVDKIKCGWRYLTPIQAYTEMLEAQAGAEDGNQGWAFDDPDRVALTGLAALLKVNEASITHLKKSKESQGKKIYEWRPKGRKARYMVVVSRPYWLSFYSKKNGRVAWVMAAAYEECTN